jgi:PIN domain
MLETKNVFLDTSTIIGHNFDYQAPAMKRLEELALAGQAHLVTTTITVAEIESNIRERLVDAKAGFDRFRDKHPIIGNVREFELNPIDSSDLLIRQLREFLERTKTEILKPHASSIDDVFQQYFDKKPPFGEAKKKSEFPDAFVAATLERWCAERGEKIYVIANDPDFKAYCETSKNLLSLERPGEFIDKVMRQDEQMRLVEESTSSSVDSIATAIGEKFEMLGFYLEDQDGDVTDVEVASVEIEELSLLEVKDHVGQFEVTVKVNFAVRVMYDDMDTAIWDSEDKVSIPLHTIRSRLKRDEEVTTTIDVRLSPDGEFQSVAGVHFPYQDVAITVRDHDLYG